MSAAPIQSTVPAEFSAEYSVQKVEVVKAELGKHLIDDVTGVVLSYLRIKMLPSMLSHHQFTVENDTLTSATFQRRNGKLQLNAATKNNNRSLYIEDLEGVEPRREIPDYFRVPPYLTGRVYLCADETYVYCDRNAGTRYDHGSYWGQDPAFRFAEVLNSRELIAVTPLAIHKFPDFSNYNTRDAANYGANGAYYYAATMHPDQTLLFVACRCVLKTYRLPELAAVPGDIMDNDTIALSANRHELASLHDPGPPWNIKIRCALWDVEYGAKMMSFQPYSSPRAPRYELALSENFINIRIEDSPHLRVDHYDIRTPNTKPSASTKTKLTHTIDG